MLFDPLWSRHHAGSTVIRRFVPTSAPPPLDGVQSIMGHTRMSCGTDHKTLRLDMEGFCRFIRRAFPTSTAAHLAAVVGATVSTSEKWISGQTKPSADHLAAMISAFGPAFLVEAIPSTRQWAAPIIERAKLAEISRQLSEILDAAE
ncbi:MAG: XRE family transcriptional regulator [Mesorhizobium sp.]|uniref:helix-turn-helix domain-containing protein n=1 Tax=Mesorhizobium sp. TaxID=1871066 RepID=UPI000FE8C833|nr:helix-turn-helix transcriptional regulator [Mesorhizobium sp.]RWF41610.1 MAG: XRE family transcriptional regulator [Mesorhizobium sp.]